MAKFLEPLLTPILNGEVTPEEAIAVSRQHLEQNRHDPRWCIPWAFVLWQQGEFLQAYNVAKEHHSSLQGDSDFLLLYGMICRQLPERVSEAEASFNAAIVLSPQRADAYYNLGNLFFHQERFEEAISQYRLSLNLNPVAPLAWLNLGLSARSVDQLELSYRALGCCLRLDPDCVRAWCNFGITCHQLERFGPAIEAYKQALSLDKSDGPTLVNLAMSLNASNRHPEAVGYLQAASSLTLQEDSGDALFNLALTRLLLGDFVRGWELYECRFKTRQYFEYKRIPRGEWVQSSSRLRELSRQGSALLVWSEQGLGDAIQFCRYLVFLQEMGFDVELATRPSLVRLFQEWLSPSIPVIDDSEIDISADERPHTAMLSLPHLLGTSEYTVPAVLPYLHPSGPPPEPLLVPSPPGGLAVGFVWASNPDNKLMYRRKSIPLSSVLEPLLPALREDLLELHCLQGALMQMH